MDSQTIIAAVIDTDNDIDTAAVLFTPFTTSCSDDVPVNDDIVEKPRDEQLAPRTITK